MFRWLALDCKLLICELMSELKTAKVRFLEEQLMWHGIEKDEISKAIKVLQERGVIYRKNPTTVELTDPLNT
ncbi:MAG: hypothetical protein GF416_09010 [Candidatus Altiarchaeales archaeon]|nr:hypothetical protein [Candidatus Altiarchaeales archaeon]MBD3417257.1 hypothetical protein [Candidatus Altiarchaeales archaeon]